MVLISLVSVLNLLYFYISTFRSMCAVSHMAVFCSSSTSCFPGMLLTHFYNDYEIVPVAPIITGITFVFTFHMRCISTVRSLYFRIFSAFIIIIIITIINRYHTTLVRTPLDDRSGRCRDLYLTTHYTHARQTSMPPVRFEPAIPAGEWQLASAYTWNKRCF